MPRRRSYLLKYLTMFFLGASCVVLTIQASGTVNIDTNLSNAVQYIKDIVLTSNGSNSGGTTGIILSGAGIGQFFGATGSYVQIVGGAYQTGWGDIAGITINGTNSIAQGFGLWHSDAGSRLWGFDRNIYMGAMSGYITITTGGNVGVGTSTPTEDLQVADYAWIGRNNTYLFGTGGSFLKLYGRKNGNDMMGLDGSIPSYVPNIQLNYTSNPGFGNDSYYNRQIFGGSSFFIGFSSGADAGNYHNRFTIDDNGNVGIGTTSPGSKLEINGDLMFSKGATRNIGVITSTSTGDDLNISAGNGFHGYDGGGSLYLRGGDHGSIGTSGAAGGHVFINGGAKGGTKWEGSNGNVLLANERGMVGIGLSGTNYPDTKLEVNGNFKLDDWLGNAGITFDPGDECMSGQEGEINFNNHKLIICLFYNGTYNRYQINASRQGVGVGWRF